MVFFLIIFTIFRFDLSERALQYDQGDYGYTAYKMLYDNYEFLDIFDNKPIGTYIIYMSFIKTFGVRPLSLHLISVISDILIMLLIFLLGYILYNKSIGLFAASIYSLMYYSFTMSFYGFLESPMMVFSLLSILFYFLYFKKNKNIFLFLSGISLGISFFIKQPAIILLPIFLIHLFFFKNRVKSLDVNFYKISLSIISGFLLICSVVIVYLIKKGLLIKFIYFVFYFSFTYRDPTHPLSFMLKYFFTVMPFLAILSFCGIYALFKMRSFHNSFLLIWLFMNVLFLFLASDFQQHYLIQIVPVLVIITSYFLYKTKKNMFISLIFILFLIYNITFSFSDIYLAHHNKVVFERGITDYFERDAIYFIQNKLFGNGLHGTYIYNNKYQQTLFIDYMESNLAPNDRISSSVPTFPLLLNRTNHFKGEIGMLPMIRSFYDMSDLPEYASRSKFFVYALWQEKRGYISSKFIECIKKNWHLVDEISYYNIMVFENTDNLVCKSVW